jgi:tRNA threonylcarbamoyladenosine biosynthesis protein TsaB
MRLLAVETSGTHGGIALMEDGRVLDEVRLTEGLRHARDLIAAIKEACDRAGWGRRTDVVALSIGPGSFTGIRIAVTFAKFVAWDAGAKVVAVPTLRVLAENAPADCGRIVPILDAKRGGLFAGIFERRDEDVGARRDEDVRARRGSGGALSNLEETFSPALIEPEALARRLEAPALILGPGVPKGRQALAAFDLAPEELWAARPAVVARLGWELHEMGRYADPLRLEPVYIRPPEAQEIWERNHGK